MSALDPTAPAVEGRALAVGYPDRVVVRELGFALPRGRTLSLVGTNGSGKTTLLRTLAGLLPPRGGELRVLGRPPGASPARVAYLGQHHRASTVLPLRAVDVVRMGRFAGLGLLRRASREDERAVAQALEVMRVSELRDAPLDALSGGQRQRVLIAQALARGAELLLLDEPAASLDRAARETLRGAVREATCAGCAAVIATHDLEEAAQSDEVMLLANRLVGYGRPAEVLTAEALLSTFGVVARPGAAGLVVEHEHDHDHGCDGEASLP